MATLLLARLLNITLHLAIVGSLVDIDLQTHNGRLRDAFIHTAVVSACILLLAVAGFVAMKLLGKSADKLQIKVIRAPEKSRRVRKRKSRKPAPRKRK